MREAVDAGCTSFEFHSDGACDQVLAFLGKNIRIADIERTIDMACQVEGANVGYTFFYDLPRGNLRNIVALAEFWAKATFRCRRKLGYLSTTRIRIYPHTRLYEIAVREGKISQDENMLNPALLWVQFYDRALDPRLLYSGFPGVSFSFEEIFRSLARTILTPTHIKSNR